MQDLRLAFRSLRATPIVTVVAILSLALGIGAAIFSLVDSLVLRSLPVVEPQRLVVISDTRGIRGGFTSTWTYSIWDQIRKRAEPFDGSCSWSTERFNLRQGGGETQGTSSADVNGARVHRALRSSPRWRRCRLLGFDGYGLLIEADRRHTRVVTVDVDGPAPARTHRASRSAASDQESLMHYSGS
jgi:hypothetical protein